MISLACDAGLRVANMSGDVTVRATHLPLAQVETAVTPFAFA